MALLAACVLTSCIDCHEEIWLAADGSGHAQISYTLPAAAAKFQGGEAGVRAMIGKFLADTTAIKTSSYQVSTEKDRLKIDVQASFDSALDLKAVSTDSSMKELPSSASSLAGKFEVASKGRTIDFARTISPGSALPGAGFMPASAFDGHNLVYIIHLPMAAKESNATRTEDDGRTLVWDFPLAQAITSPVSTRFKAEIPIPKSLIVASSFTLLIAFWTGFLVLRKLRKIPRSGDSAGVD
ncbi:MAG: hypothetical protein ABI162_08785 [Luteolibacter sp.]